MTNNEIQSYRIGCQNSADYISSEIGSETVEFILAKYGAADIESISPSDLQDVFNELYGIEADLRN